MLVRQDRRSWTRCVHDSARGRWGISGRLPCHHRLPHRPGRHYRRERPYRATAANCPNTKMVLGGFSQGAAVMGFVTSNVFRMGLLRVHRTRCRQTWPPRRRGRPVRKTKRPVYASDQSANVEIGPLYAAKTIDLCVPDDFVCSSGRDFNAHLQYAETGMVDQAATFTANLLPAPAPAAPPRSPAPAARPQPSAPAPAAPPQAPAPAPQPPPQSPAPAPPAIDALHPLPPGTELSCSTTCHIIGPA